MKNVRATFSVNRYDDDGDIVKKCILLHINNGLILEFDNLDDVIEFKVSIGKCINEIEENYDM